MTAALFAVLFVNLGAALLLYLETIEALAKWGGLWGAKA